MEGFFNGQQDQPAGVDSNLFFDVSGSMSEIRLPGRSAMFASGVTNECVRQTCLLAACLMGAACSPADESSLLADSA